MLKAVFFDNDGVLVDTEALYYRATRDVLGRAGVELTEEIYIEFLLRQGRGAWFLLEEKGCSAAEIGRLRQQRNELYAGLLQSEAILIDGVEACIRDLFGRAVLAIVTTSRRDHFDIIHRRTGLLAYFDFWLTAEDFARSKPDAAPYLKALERSGFRAEECLVVEDSERGLTAAVAAGLRCMVVPRGLTRQGNFEKAYSVNHNLADAVGQMRRELF